MRTRSVARRLEAQDTSDGAGVRLRRSIGTPQLDQLDPFLLLDEFKSDDAADYLAGFPEHPHRGFETVTYMLAGSMEHRDHAGHSGAVLPGGVQWMTAGRGIVHSEMPRQQSGLMWGFQLWVNLPAAEKMREPRYQEFAPESIPELTRESGARLRVVAGQLDGRVGPVVGIVTEPLFLDVTLPAGAGFDQEVPAEHSAFAYVFEGAVGFGAADDAVQAGELAVLEGGERISARAAGQAGGRLLLLAARPLREPVARFGPFVMNTRAELVQAADDFQAGRFQ